MLENIYIIVIMAINIPLSIYILIRGIKKNKLNMLIKTKGTIVKGVVHSFYRIKDSDGTDKLPVIQYKAPGSETYSYFNSRISMMSNFTAYDKGDEVEVFYYEQDDKVHVKINNDKYFFTDSTNLIVLSGFMFVFSLALLFFVN